MFPSNHAVRGCRVISGFILFIPWTVGLFFDHVQDDLPCLLGSQDLDLLDGIDHLGVDLNLFA